MSNQKHLDIGTYAFKASSREKQSHYSIMIKAGPPLGHYTPHYG